MKGYCSFYFVFSLTIFFISCQGGKQKQPELSSAEKICFDSLMNEYNGSVEREISQDILLYGEEGGYSLMIKTDCHRAFKERDVKKIAKKIETLERQRDEMNLNFKN